MSEGFLGPLVVVVFIKLQSLLLELLASWPSQLECSSAASTEILSKYIIALFTDFVEVTSHIAIEIN